MIEFEYMNYIVELMFGEEMTEELFCRRFAALRELRGIIAGYEKEGFRKDLLETIFCKKADFIMEAESEEDMEEILKLSCPEYRNGEFHIDSRFHVEEEEMLMWSYVSAHQSIYTEGAKRYEALYDKYMGEKEEEAKAA